MSRTSRVLRQDELSEVSPIWWRDGGSAPPGTAPPPRLHAPPPASHGVSDAEKEREAHQRGFAEGKALGREQAAAELSPLMDRLGRALAGLSRLRARIRS